MKVGKLYKIKDNVVGFNDIQDQNILIPENSIFLLVKIIKNDHYYYDHHYYDYRINILYNSKLHTRILLFNDFFDWFEEIC